MSSCTACGSAAQAYQATSAKSYLQQQLASIQDPAKAAPDDATSSSQPLNGSGRGQLVNVMA